VHQHHSLEHEHFHNPELALEVEEVEGLEMFRLRSVGIDIGSSTTHLVFSLLTLRREGSALSARFIVTDREVLHRSPIMMTPYLSGTLIDIEKVKSFIHGAYREAGFVPEDIDTGAVVITGEALKKENARPIAELFATESGKFICASAGPKHEGLLAAHGSGAVALSKAEKATVMNLDVGGGTAKLSIIRNGVVEQTAAISVGARLIAYDEDGVVTRVETPVIRIMQELGYEVSLGKRVTEKEKEELAGLMARLLFEVVQGGALSPLTQELMITEPLKGYQGLEGIDFLVFSGGVSEYIYGHDHESLGDVGPLFGQQIRQHVEALPRSALLREPLERIRATVIGAGEYTVQASGSTSYIGSTNSLPVHGLKVVRPMMDGGDSVEGAINRALARFDLPNYTSGLALAISLNGQLDYPALRRIAEGVAVVLQGSDDPEAPLFLILDMDVAKSLGGILKEELHVPQDVIAVDGIDVGDLDYVDIGRPMGVSEVLPVTVKSLTFPSPS